MNHFPLIGISGSVTADETQHFLLRDYMRAVIAGGGVPVLLSPDLTDDMLDACLSRLGGLLLAGGNDAAPALFGETPIEQLGEINPLRDQFEVRLLRRAVSLRMPVLGICRGAQMMAAALAGFAQPIPHAGWEAAYRPPANMSRPLSQPRGIHCAGYVPRLPPWLRNAGG
mgnify:CR=1 FL=1